MNFGHFATCSEIGKSWRRLSKAWESGKICGMWLTAKLKQLKLESTIKLEADENHKIFDPDVHEATLFNTTIEASTR